MMIISILEPLPTHIITSPSTSLCLFCNSCFELLILAIEEYKYPGATMNTSKVHINNMYIKYTFVHFDILLIRQVFGVAPLPVTIPFVVESLSFRLRSSFGLLHGSDNLLAILFEVPFLPFALFLKLVVLFNHQHLVLFIDFYLHRFQHHEELGNRFSSSLAYYSSSRSSSNLVMVTRELCQSLILYGRLTPS